MSIVLPVNVEYIINRLQENGYEAYAVGGCIRDSIMNIQPKDWDLTTDALPIIIKKLFSRTVDTGIKHGTITILIDDEAYEITTFRIDGKYLDGRHPSEVSFTPNLKDDLLRRDFTINSLAYNKKNGLVDYFSGREDISKGLIRCVGNSKHRFEEDALRILRAIRFSAQLNFRIESKTLEAMQLISGNLKLVSKERVRDEIVKTLMSGNPNKLELIEKIGAIKTVFPFLQEQNRLESLSFDLLVKTDNYILRLVLLFYLLKLEPKEAMKYLKFDNKSIDRVGKLIGEFKKYAKLSDYSLKYIMTRIGYELSLLFFKFLLIIRKVDLDTYTKVVQRIEEIDAEECYYIKDLAISGNDLLKLGYSGRQIGLALERALDMVIREPSLNCNEILIKKLANLR